MNEKTLEQGEYCKNQSELEKQKNDIKERMIFGSELLLPFLYKYKGSVQQ